MGGVLAVLARGSLFDEAGPRAVVAGVGTALALSWLWLIAVALAGVYFVYSAKIEEHYLTEQFPDAYPGYRRSTKMLVPLIL